MINSRGAWGRWKDVLEKVSNFFQVLGSVLPVIKQSITGDFEFGTCSKSGTALFGDLYRLYYPLSIALPVHNPLVETACCYGEESAHVEVGEAQAELSRRVQLKLSWSVDIPGLIQGSNRSLSTNPGVQ